MNNVKTMTGEPFAQLGEPVPKVIEVIKKFLVKAEAGVIRQIHIIGVSTDGSVERSAEGPGFDMMLVGATAWSMHRLCDSMNYRDNTEPPPPDK